MALFRSAWISFCKKKIKKERNKMTNKYDLINMTLDNGQVIIGIFTDGRCPSNGFETDIINSDKVNKYDIRHSDYDFNIPCTIEPRVIVNRFGSILTNSTITFPEEDKYVNIISYDIFEENTKLEDALFHILYEAPDNVYDNDTILFTDSEIGNYLVYAPINNVRFKNCSFGRLHFYELFMNMESSKKKTYIITKRYVNNNDIPNNMIFLASILSKEEIHDKNLVLDVEDYMEFLQRLCKNSSTRQCKLSDILE